MIRTVPPDVWQYIFGLVYKDFNRILYLPAVDSSSSHMSVLHGEALSVVLLSSVNM